MAEATNRGEGSWVMHSALLGASFMTMYDRTRRLSGGFFGAAMAGAAIWGRKHLTDKYSEESGMIGAVASAVELSAITSLMGSSM